MRIILELIEIIWLIVGCAVTMSMIYFAIDNITNKIKHFMKRQNKIRCLCHHEYIVDWAWGNEDYKEYRYRCRKCGRILKINVVGGERK